LRSSRIRRLSKVQINNRNSLQRGGKRYTHKNNYIEQKKHLILNDGILRGTIGARCYCDALVSIEGDAYNGTGILMRKGVVHVMGDAGMNSGAHLDGVL